MNQVLKSGRNALHGSGGPILVPKVYTKAAEQLGARFVF